jgi:hypothetical protein
MPTDVNHRRCISMQRPKIFERTHDEVGEIIVADVNLAAATTLVDPIARALTCIDFGSTNLIIGSTRDPPAGTQFVEE